MLHALIMAGGGGTRFWPRSRQCRPKQFLTLTGDRSLLQQAHDRIEAAVPPERTWVITAGQHREETSRQLPALPGDRVIGEPCGRDTAACIGLGAALIARQDPSAVMMVMPADHVIEPVQEFRRAAHVAELMAEEHTRALITFGIPPSFPATGYGYIHRGAEVAQRQGIGVWKVKAFREKPSSDVAERFVASGEYYWNSGIFVWKAATILGQLRERQPKLHAAVQRIAEAWSTPQREAVLATEYDGLERISIDFAVMEHAPEVLVVQAPYRWDDVGSWLALERMHPQDADGNTVLSQHVGLRTQGCIVAADPGHLVATVGVNNLLIVQDGNATLVADRSDEAGVKQLVELLKKKGLEKYLLSRLLGIDFGDVRIGLAVSDRDRKIASPLATYRRRGRAADAAYFQQVVRDEEVGQIVLGLPVHLNGNEGAKAKAARAFGRWLGGVVGLPIVFWDERFTTVEAESHLWTAGLTHKRRKERRDQVAAQILLQAYLDAGCPGEQPLGPLEGEGAKPQAD